MKAFKKVQDFAAKEQNVTDGQREWAKWKVGPKEQAKPESGDMTKTDIDLPVEKKVRLADEESSVDATTWTMLTDSHGKTYWFNAATGETTWTEPQSDESSTKGEQSAENNDSRLETKGSDSELSEVRENVVSKGVDLPAQIWEKRIDTLTRKPNWYCEELNMTVTNAPLPHPWRGVVDGDGRLYFWNVETGETRWPQ